MTENIHYSLKKYNKYFQNIPLSAIPILRKEDISTKYSHFRVSGDGKIENKHKPVPTTQDIKQKTLSTYKKNNHNPYDNSTDVKNIYKNCIDKQEIKKYKRYDMRSRSRSRSRERRSDRYTSKKIRDRSRDRSREYR
jgi:hypothetical protein